MKFLILVTNHICKVSYSLKTSKYLLIQHKFREHLVGKALEIKNFIKSQC